MRYQTSVGLLILLASCAARIGLTRRSSNLQHDEKWSSGAASDTSIWNQKSAISKGRGAGARHNLREQAMVTPPQGDMRRAEPADIRRHALLDIGIDDSQGPAMITPNKGQNKLLEEEAHDSGYCQTLVCNVTRSTLQNLRQFFLEVFYFEHSVITVLVPEITSFLHNIAPWITANMITCLNLVWPFAVGWAVAKQHTGALYLAVACQEIMDWVDGSYARTFHQMSPFGHFLDRLIDSATYIVIILGNILVHRNWKMLIVVGVGVFGNILDLFFHLSLFKAIGYLTRVNGFAFRVLLYHLTRPSTTSISQEHVESKLSWSDSVKKIF